MSVKMESAHLPDVIRAPYAALGATLGLPIDQLCLLTCLLSAIPLGSLHKRLPNPLVKHVYTLIIGLFYSWLVIGPSATLQLLAYAAINYVVCLSLLSSPATRKRMPLYMTLLNMVCMSVLHVHRMITDFMGWSLDISLCAMILVVKLNMFAYNLSDGDRLARGEQLSEKPHVAQHRAERALVKRPSMLQFLAYAFYYPSVLVGPCTEMKQYLDYTDMSLFNRHGFKSIPSSTFASLISLRNAALCYIGMAVAGIYPILGFVNTDAFYAMPLWRRWIYFWVSTTACRYKYYFAWYLAEAGVQATGLSFEVTDAANDKLAHAKKSDDATNGTVSSDTASKTIVWSGCNNVEATRVELGTHIPILTTYWNKGVSMWLKDYVYLRVQDVLPRSVTKVMPAKSCANIVTKFMSAFWHGFYSSYYVFFLGAWLCTEMDDAFRVAVEDRVMSTGNKPLIMTLKFL